MAKRHNVAPLPPAVRAYHSSVDRPMDHSTEHAPTTSAEKLIILSLLPAPRTHRRRPTRGSRCMQLRNNSERFPAPAPVGLPTSSGYADTGFGQAVVRCAFSDRKFVRDSLIALFTHTHTTRSATCGRGRFFLVKTDVLTTALVPGTNELRWCKFRNFDDVLVSPPHTATRKRQNTARARKVVDDR